MISRLSDSVLGLSILLPFAPNLVSFDQLFQRTHVLWFRVTEALVITLRDKLLQRNHPRFLLLVGQGPELLRIHSQFASHLDVRVAQLEAPSCLKPRLRLRGDAFHVAAVVFSRQITAVPTWGHINVKVRGAPLLARPA
jgi:hypothetical protein